VIVSNNVFNQSGLRTVLTIPVTSNADRATAPGNVRLPRRSTGLAKDSVALVVQVGTTDKRCFIERIGRVPDEVMHGIDAALRLALAL
jgi:mRNA interferase MazF